MSGPIPPHERSWRHPSELAAESRRLVATETQSRQGRFIALGLGMTGVLAIVAAIALITPSVLEPSLESTSGIADLRTTPAITLEPGSTQPDQPDTAAPAIGADGVDADSSTTGSDGTDPGQEMPDEPLDRSAGDDPADDPADDGAGDRAGDAAAGTTGDGDIDADPSPSGTADPTMAPLATPLAAGGLGVVAASAIRQVLSLGGQIGDRLSDLDWELPFKIDIRLADGTVTEVDVLDPGGQDTPALIRLPDAMDVGGYRPSVAAPRPDDMVTVLADDPIVMRFAELTGLDPSRIHRGTAIIDRQGRLLGLCEHTETANTTSIRIVMISKIDFAAATTRSD